MGHDPINTLSYHCLSQLVIRVQIEVFGFSFFTFTSNAGNAPYLRRISVVPCSVFVLVDFYGMRPKGNRLKIAGIRL